MDNIDFLPKKHLWWLSFADEDRCRGIVITEEVDVVAAVAKCWALEINPGGQVMGFEIPYDCAEATTLPHNELMSEEFIISRGNIKLKDLPDEVLDAIDRDKDVHVIDERDLDGRY